MDGVANYSPSVSIALDTKGNLHISYHYIVPGSATGAIKYAKKQGTDAFESVRAQLESDLDQAPDDYRLHLALSEAYSGLQQKQRALEHAAMAQELMPVSRDALSGTGVLANVARIQVRVGEFDAALANLDQLLAMPSDLSVEELRLFPVWDALRDDPRFVVLLNRGHTVF